MRPDTWIGAMLIRWMFERGGDRIARGLKAHTPQGVRTYSGIRYRQGDLDARLDVHIPIEGGPAWPTVVWIHGGAWLSGHRDDVVPFLMRLAEAGFAVVSVDYPRAPRTRYPVALHRINEALTFVTTNAVALHADPTRVVLAGDSAGAQLASQLAAVCTSDSYAASLDLTPALRADQVRGAMLYCGIYDLRAFVERGRNPGLNWGTSTIVRAYTGGEAGAVAQMSTVEHVTEAFPPSFICGGRADALTAPQSRPFAARLAQLGVDVTALFPDNPRLGHEYQFDLDSADGRDALERSIEFLRERLG
jgi:acetyl esterase/lipase